MSCRSEAMAGKVLMLYLSLSQILKPGNCTRVRHNSIVKKEIVEILSCKQLKGDNRSERFF
jgi:hypothetical protein